MASNIRLFPNLGIFFVQVFSYKKKIINFFSKNLTKDQERMSKPLFVALFSVYLIVEVSNNATSN